MGTIFDGREFAKRREEILKEKVSKLQEKPKLVSILVGKDSASLLYTKLKQQAARRVGIDFIIYHLPFDVEFKKVVETISELNNDKTVNGIMVQLPLPTGLDRWKAKIVRTIALSKDVDGLRRDSSFMQATVKAVKEIVEEAVKDLAYFGKKASVIGAKGTVGGGVVKILTKMGYKVCECDKDTRDLYTKLTEADLVVSATGVAGLIKPEMVKEGVIAIDVGSPTGDLDPKIAEKAGFFTPVPGGVGPVTIVSLLENLVESLV